MRKSKIKQISLAVCLALMPFSAYAAGLGKLNVNSGLGEPLKAEIELLSVTPEELAGLVASIATEESYASQGITRLSIHNNIKIELSKNADGSPLLKLRSTQPISDPYLDMLIQVEWATGRLQREYTILLDPPGYKNTVDTASVMPIQTATINTFDAAPAANSAVVSDQQYLQKSFKKPKKQAKNTTALPAQDENLAANTEQDLITKRGDTLIAVAKTLQVEGVSLDQMLVGLYENNKNAFSSDNMNRMKVGQIIKLPNKDDLIAIDEQQAKQTIKLQSTHWNAYRNALAANVTKAPVKAGTEQKQSASGKIANAEDKATPAKAGSQDVVKLSAGDKDSAAKGVKDTNKAADAKIVALQDEATAREKSLKEAQERTNALEKQIQDMQKLLALKSQSMNQLQKDAEAVAKQSSVAIAEESKAEATAKVEVAPVIVPTPLVEKSPATEPKSQEAAPVVVAEVKKAGTVSQPKTSEKMIPAAKAEAGLLEGLLNAVDIVLLAAAAGVALLGAGWMFLRNKRRKDLDSFERGILTSGGLRANTVFGNTTGNASTSDTSFLTDFSQNADGVMIDTNDVDPIAEAEVYMAYGRDAQAEEILKDAIIKEPRRYELHIKLLEMYVARKDNSAFEAIAGELYTTLGAGDPTWAKVAAMGAILEPANPLYEVNQLLAASAFDAPKIDALEIQASATAIDSDLEFSLDASAKDSVIDDQLAEASAVEVENPDQAMSFDMGALNLSNDESSLDVGMFNGNQLDHNLSDNVFPESNYSDELTTADVDTSELSKSNFSNSDFAVEAEVEEEIIDETPAVEVVAALAELANDNSIDFDVADLTKAADVISAPMTVANELAAFNANTTPSDTAASQVIDSALLDENTESSDLNLTTPENNAQSSLKPDVKSNVLDDISFEMDFSLDEPSLSNKAVINELPVKQDESSISNAAAIKPVIEDDDFDTEISFDLPDNEDATSDSEAISEANDLAANNFDLSSISLDLADTEIEMFPETSSPQASNEIEPPDVNIKLDLVAAYIDMDDKEGAIELLEEVMKEGGINQKVRAQALLDSLA